MTAFEPKQTFGLDGKDAGEEAPEEGMSEMKEARATTATSLSAPSPERGESEWRRLILRA
jgi:hypothetical protein